MSKELSYYVKKTSFRGIYGNEGMFIVIKMLMRSEYCLLL